MFAANIIFFKFLIMKKQILSIGNALNKVEQKEIFGGGGKGFSAGCTNPSGNVCDPSASQSNGNPACNLGEVCSLQGTGANATCICPD